MMKIERHKTAIRRTTLSRPVKLLLESGLLTPDTTFFDYGCGLGDDVKLLQKHGYDASGWDPYYAPSSLHLNCDVVNLGFVLNVIEDPSERHEALRQAFEIANTCLSVAVMLDVDSNRPEGVRFNDGTITNRTTFQRLYTQEQLSTTVHSTLQVDPVSISPGIVFVFKSSIAKNSFRYRRLRRNHLAIDVSTPANTVLASQVDELTQRFTTEWRDYLEFVSQRGRPPDPIESRFVQLCSEYRIKPDRAFEKAKILLGADTIGRAADETKSDIITMLALSQFSSKINFGDLPEELRRDVRSFFGSHKNAVSAAHKALLSIGDLDQRNLAAETPGCPGKIGHDFLLINPEEISELPLPLRLYVELGSLFLGSPREAQQIKVHLQSNKLTFFYDANTIGMEAPSGVLLAAKLNFSTRKIDTYVISNH